MDFLLFQVLFAVLVIALAISGWMLLRSLRERREAKTQGWSPPARQPHAPRLQAPRLGRKSAPEPIAKPEAVHVRKRQIVPLAALETATEPETETEDGGPTAENDALVAAAPEPTGNRTGGNQDSALPADDVLGGVSADMAEAASSPPPAPASAPGLVHGETMDLLEDAFVRLQREEITLADYCERISAQERALADRMAVLAASDDPGASAARDDTRAAQEAVRWCREWADDRVREAAGDPSPS